MRLRRSDNLLLSLFKTLCCEGILQLPTTAPSRTDGAEAMGPVRSPTTRSDNDTGAHSLNLHSLFQLFYSSTVGELSSGIDLETGLFTAGWAGTYQVTLSLQNSDHNNEKSQGLQLLKNGESVPEVYFHTKYNDNSATKEGKIRLKVW